LTLDEVTERTERALEARSRAEVRRALSKLPALPNMGGVAAEGGSVVQSVVRGAMLLALTGAYLLFSFALLLVLGLTLLVQGVSGSGFVGFLFVWLVPTYLLARLWRRPR